MNELCKIVNDLRWKLIEWRRFDRRENARVKNMAYNDRKNTYILKGELL